MKQQKLYFQSPAGKLHYLLSLPRAYTGDPGHPWPLILFLHGAGERGGDLKQLKKQGLPKLIHKSKDFPFITISPQCPPGTGWGKLSGALLALLEHVMARFAANPRRVYLTGLSMGGGAVWRLGVLRPDLFAALVPICGPVPGGARFFQRLALLKNTPIWVFHGALDQNVPVENSRHIVTALRALGANVIYTEYPDVAHDSWTPAYADPELFRWLLEQSRPAVF